MTIQSLRLHLNQGPSTNIFLKPELGAWNVRMQAVEEQLDHPSSSAYVTCLVEAVCFRFHDSLATIGCASSVSDVKRQAQSTSSMRGLTWGSKNRLRVSRCKAIAREEKIPPILFDVHAAGITCQMRTSCGSSLHGVAISRQILIESLGFHVAPCVDNLLSWRLASQSSRDFHSRPLATSQKTRV